MFCLSTSFNYGILHIVRYANPLWKIKDINSEMKRLEGLCPLTPEETALVLVALGIDHNVQIYIAAGEIYGGNRRMESLKSAFPNLVSRTKKKQPFQQLYIIGLFHYNLLELYGTGQKRDSAGAFGLEAFPKPLFSKGSIGLSCLPRE